MTHARVWGEVGQRRSHVCKCVFFFQACVHMKAREKPLVSLLGNHLSSLKAWSFLYTKLELQRDASGLVFTPKGQGHVLNRNKEVKHRAFPPIIVMIHFFFYYFTGTPKNVHGQVNFTRWF